MKPWRGVLFCSPCLFETRRALEGYRHLACALAGISATPTAPKRSEDLSRRCLRTGEDDRRPRDRDRTTRRVDPGPPWCSYRDVLRGRSNATQSTGGRRLRHAAGRLLGRPSRMLPAYVLDVDASRKRTATPGTCASCPMLSRSRARRRSPSARFVGEIEFSFFEEDGVDREAPSLVHPLSARRRG